MSPPFTQHLPATAPPTWCVRIEPLGAEFDIQAQESVLEAAQRAGVHLPRSCRNGTCRTCLCQLSSGQVSYRVAWPGLSPDDHDDGAVLPCVALAASDLVLRAVKAQWQTAAPSGPESS